MTKLKDDILDDRLTVFLAIEEFAQEFTWNSITIKGLFRNPYTGVPIGEIEAESSNPAASFRPEDTVGIAHGDSVTRIDTGVVYKVTGVKPDGRGWVLITLSQD